MRLSILIIGLIALSATVAGTAPHESSQTGDLLDYRDLGML